MSVSLEEATIEQIIRELGKRYEALVFAGNRPGKVQGDLKEVGDFNFLGSNYTCRGLADAAHDRLREIDLGNPQTVTRRHPKTGANIDDSDEQA